MITTTQALNAKSGEPYTGSNSSRLGNSGVWATYRQWLELGRQVQKGQHGVRLVRFQPLEQADGSTKKKPVKAFTVFERSQTELIADFVPPSGDCTECGAIPGTQHAAYCAYNPVEVVDENPLGMTDSGDTGW